MTQTPVTNPYLAINQIQDQYVRKNFENLNKYFQEQNQLLDFKFFELTFDKAATGFVQAHGLPYIPLDVIVTRISGTGAVTFQYGKFDLNNLVMDVSGPCRIRFFAGTCSKIISAVQTQSGDAQKYSSGV